MIGMESIERPVLRYRAIVVAVDGPLCVYRTSLDRQGPVRIPPPQLVSQDPQRIGRNDFSVADGSRKRVCDLRCATISVRHGRDFSITHDLKRTEEACVGNVG